MNNTHILRSANVSSRSFFRTSIPTSFAIALVVLFSTTFVLASNAAGHVRENVAGERAGRS